MKILTILINFVVAGVLTGIFTFFLYASLGFLYIIFIIHFILLNQLNNGVKSKIIKRGLKK